MLTAWSAVELYPYQDASVAEIRAAFRRGVRKVLYVLPTGGGKTVIFCFIAEQALRRGNRVLILVHRQELIEQTVAALSQFGIECGIIAAGYEPSDGLPVQVASVMTLVRREVDGFDLVIVDEAHHAVAGSWRGVLDKLTNARILGVTATPERLDGRGLGDAFDEMVIGPSTAELTHLKYLVPAVVYGHTTYELKLDYASAKTIMEKATADTAAQTFVDLVLAGDDFGADEIETLRNLASDISRITKRSLNRKLNDARRASRGTAGPDGAAHAAELLQLFNEQYAVVNESGKAKVYEEVRDPLLERNVLIRIHFEDLKKFYQNLFVEVVDNEGNMRTRPAGDYWLDHPDRRQYLGGVVFDPTGKTDPEHWNLWSGFAVEPRRGDWGLMQDHIRKIICRGNDDHYEYLLNMTARMFQQPNRQAEVAVVLRGPKGAGKGVFCTQLVKAWGQHGAQITSSKHLVGNFNNHLRDCVMLFADEAFFAGDRQHEGVLKGLITETILPIEGKHVDVVFVRNMLHVYMSSNSEWVVPASHDERRYFVLDVPDTRIGNRAYFNALYAQMESGGLAALIYDMLRRDISGFDPRDVPSTEALVEQKQLSLDSLDRWWLDVLERGFVWRSRHGVDTFGGWDEFVSTELLNGSYLQWCRESRESRSKSRVELGVRMTKMYKPVRPRKSVITGEVEVRPPKAADSELVIKKYHMPGYKVLSLGEARARFADIRGVIGGWRQIDEE